MNIYKITIGDLDTPGLGLQAISIVDFPAVERNFIKFKDEKQPQRVMLKADDDQHVIIGVALLADTPIYRYDPAMGGDYYIVFERETIKQLVEKYSRDGLLNVINLQHDETTYSVDSCTMIESYFVNNERGICPMEFKGVPDGSWIVSFKVTDEELWQKIKDSKGKEDELNGFSVEVNVYLEPKLKAAKCGEELSLDALADYLLEGKENPVEGLFSVTKGDIRSAMDKQRQLEITVQEGEKERTVVAQIKELGKRDGKVIINTYLPEKDVWKVIEVEKIVDIVVTETPLAPWNYDLPSYDDIKDDPNITITDSVVASREAIETCIDGQYFAMITYDDESKEHTPATGMRQVQICAYGTSLRGNECFRAYEYYGDTSGSLPGGVGNWRLFLTRRCKSFHIMTEAKRWAVTPPGYRMGDVDMLTIYDEVDPSFISTDV